jgi:hypothetical protein
MKVEIAITVACLLVLGTMLAITIFNDSLAVDTGRAEGFYVVPMDDLITVLNRTSPLSVRGSLISFRQLVSRDVP